jgi:serine phosphatase RsbU (regulator of sigma subunit)
MEFKGNRFPVGTFVGEEIRQFTNHSIPVRSEDMVYVFSDGFSDQFGGPNGKKFMIRRFRKMLLEVHTLPLEQQQQAILNQFVDWKGNLEQIDDIVIMGVRIP